MPTTESTVAQKKGATTVSGSDTTPPRSTTPSVPSRPPDKKPFNWPLFWVRVKYWTWNVTTKVLITFIYVQLVAQGASYVMPDLGVRLYRTPFFAFLKDYTATYHLTRAHVMVVPLIVIVWLAWHFVLELGLRADAFTRGRWNRDFWKRAICTLSVIIIAGEACLFASAFTMSSWGSARFTTSAILVTAVYVSILAFCTLVSLYLGESIYELKKKEE